MKLDPSFLQRVRDGEDWSAVAAGLAGVQPTSDGLSSLTLLRAVLVQRWLALDDEQAAAEIADRRSLRDFCGLSAEGAAPAARDLRRFREQLASGASGQALLEGLDARWPGAGERRPLLSVVSPVYRAAEIVTELVRRVCEEASRITPRFELLLIDDGSPDDGWMMIEEACRRDPRVKGIKLSRNFGQHLAITAGLDEARGDWVVVMDCDLQDDPAHLPALYHKALEGYDVVFAAKLERRHAMLRNLGARAFAAALNLLTPGPRARVELGSFSILSRRAVLAFRRVGDVHRHYLGVVRWLGFPAAELPIEHRTRLTGRSSYTLDRLLHHALDGITSHSDRLLHTALAASLVFLTSSLAAAAYLVVSYYLHGFQAGWTSTIVLILLATSAILFCVWVVGLYVSRIFEQVRQRPLYVVEERRNF